MNKLVIYVLNNIEHIILALTILVFYIIAGSDSKIAKIAFYIFKVIVCIVFFILAAYFLSILYFIYFYIN